MTTQLVLATTNRGKIKELRELLVNLDVEVISIADAISTPFVVVEDGLTFRDNAIKKAVAAASLTNMLSLADDSGLEVDALDGTPGVWSARFAGEHATGEENNAALIGALRSKSDQAWSRPGDEKKFSARFRCALALVDPHSANASPIVVEEKMEGHVILEPRGTNGFGYDPLFVPTGFNRTFAELSAEEKNSLSHRARALQQIQPKIAAIIDAARTRADT
jgi:XTP/dITP diphosphohydrolase